MAGVVLETLSWKKLIILGVSLLVLLIVFFLIGGLIGKRNYIDLKIKILKSMLIEWVGYRLNEQVPY